MVRVKEFLLTTFTKSFLTLFLPFFIIISLTYLIKLSNLSSKVNLNLIDFGTLYIFVLPHIIFATIPLTFIGAIINSFAKLSEDNEMMSIFSLGYSPLKILKYLLPTALLFSLLLSIITLYIIPYAEQKMDNFERKKIYEAKLKILPKKLSQNFGNNHIFIEQNKNGIFKNVTMFSQEPNGYLQILLSKNGKIVKNNNTSYLNLNNGSLYRYKDSNFQIVDFENMKLFNNQKFYSSKIISPKEFWIHKTKKFFYYLLISLSPLFIFLILISFGIYNPRYQKNRASIYILLSTLFAYIPSMIAKEVNSIYFVIFILLFWISISYYIFKIKLLKRY